MKLLKRKKANIQDYINFAGLILFIYIVISKEVLMGEIGDIFTADNALITSSLIIWIEMLFVNLSIFITDFKNYLFERMQNRKYGKRDNDDKKEES